MAEDWGINDPVVDDENDLETWGENDPVIESEQDQEEWGINDPAVGEAAPATEAVKPPIDIVQQYGELSKRYSEKGKALTQSAQRFEQLASQPERTPEEEAEMTSSWQATLQGQADISKDMAELKRLQPQYDQYFADQEKARFEATESLRLNPALSGVVDQLHELDNQQKEQLRLVGESQDTDEIKQKKAKDITASIQKSKKDLIDGEIVKSQGVENTLTSVAEALREKEAALEKRKTDIMLGAAATVATVGVALPMAKEAIGREEAIQAESQKKIDTILANVPAEERERYVKEAEQINGLVTGDSQAAVINNELRISPTILFDDDAIKAAINISDASDLQKKALRQNIPQLQKNLAKQEIPIFNELSEFRDFVKERNLQNASDVDKIKAYKDFDGNWFGKFGAQAKLGIQRGYANLIGQTQTLFGTAADLIARGTGSEGARAVSDAFIGASMDQGDEVEKLTRMTQAVGGPQIVSEIAQVGTEMVPILASGGLVGIGAKTLAATGLRAVTPAVASNLGFATSVGTAGLQSYAGVYSDATRTLRNRFIQEGMGEDEAMDLAMRQAYLPAVLAGITTAAVTAAGGKTGVEAVFNLGKDAAFKGAVRTFFKDVASNTGMEALEETVDEFVQGMVAQATYSPDMSFGQIVEGAAKAGALGGFFGGSVGAATYGIETAQARKAIATRRPITDFNMSRINALEGELKNLQIDSPLGSAETGPFDMFNPSERASGVGARSMEKSKIDELNTRRAQLTKMLADEKLSSITQNDVESELAQADYEYVKLLAQGRNNLLTEQTLDKIGQLPAESTDAMRGLLKIANNMGAETLTGRERVALGITKVGNRFVAATEAPLIKAEADGTFSVTDSGKQAVEAQNLIPLSRMIGISEGMKTQLEEEARIEEALRQEEAKREARRTAESDEAQRYGPQASEALKQQVGSVPETPEAEQAKVRLAELLRQQQEVQRKAVEGLQKKEETGISGALQQMGEGAVEGYYQAILKSLQEKGEVPSPERTSNVGQAWDRVREQMTPEEFVKQLQQNADDLSKIQPKEVAPEGEVPPTPPTVPAVATALIQPELVSPLGKTGDEFSSINSENRRKTEEFINGLEDGDYQVFDASGEKNGVARVKTNKSGKKVVEYVTDTGEFIGDAKALIPEINFARFTDVNGNEGFDRGSLQKITPEAPPAAVEPTPVTPPVTPPVEPPVAPPTPPVEPEAGAITPETQNIIDKAQQERAGKQPAKVEIDRTKRPIKVRSLRPSATLGKSLREALLYASRINLSSVANSFPNEILMQDVAAILAETGLPTLDNEFIVTLASRNKTGTRATRFWDGDIGVPSRKSISVSTLVHEVGHGMTADQIKRYAPRKNVPSGDAYISMLRRTIADKNTPEPISRLFSLYVSTLEQLGIMDQYGKLGGIAGTKSADISTSMAKRAQAAGTLRKDLTDSQLYGLSNVEEFVSQAFSSSEFRDLLKTLKDPTNNKRSAWSAFVDAIKNILQLPNGSMAAAVIEASVDVGMEVPATRTAPPKVSRRKKGGTPEEGLMAPEEETGRTVEMSLEMEKERTFQLLGERLYTAELPKVVVKETVQNGFDAIKDAEETGEIPRGSGVITYSRKELEVNGEKIVRMMFADNGGGMTPEILQNAFFTVGGTFKRSGKGSGGFGLAKLGMFMSADRVMVETVRDGVVTTADLTKQELVDKKFNVNVAEDPNRKNGTMVVLEFKKSITRSDGKTVEFENPYTQFDKLIHHDLTVIDDSYGSYQNELIGLFQNKPSGLWTLDEIKKNMGKTPYTFEDFVRDVPNVETFEQDFVIAGAKKPIKVRVAAARLGLKRKDGKAKYSDTLKIAGSDRSLKNYNMSVYSNGLFQFEKENLKIDPMKLWGGDPLPYNIVVDIDAGGLDAASLAYPFTNSREDFQNGVVKDYVNQLLNDIRVKERQRQFDQEFNLLTDISGGKPRKDSPTLYNNTTIVPEPYEQKFLEDLTKAVFDVADDLVVALRKGNEDGILEDTWYKVKSQKGSVAPTGRAEEDSLDYFYGVGISKNWGGVNTSRDPVSVLVNPIYEERVDEYARTEFGRRILARTIAKTLIHEINHHLHRNEGSDFTFFILQNETYLGEVGAIQSAVDKILPIVNQHPDAIISLKNKFRTAETKDTDNELTGEQYERSSKEPDGQPRTTVVGGDRLVQQPSGEVSARPTSEEDGEQTGAYLPSSLTVADRQDASVGEGISFGEALSSSLVENQAQISEGGIARADGVESAPEEEFEIVPEQVEDQIAGTPEATTINVMGEAFRLANEQSAAAGPTEGTIPLETITSAWMNSGQDEAALENAIIRYTNLEPEAATTLANAIARQREIQRGIAEIADMAPKETEIEERPYSFAQRIKEELPAALRSKINKAYEVLRNEVSVQEANQVMYGMDVKEAMEATMNMQNGVSMGVRSMMAQITLRKIIDGRKNAKSKKNKADYDALVEAHVDFVDWINEYLVEMGQGIQAFARFSDLGADGMLLKLRKDTDKAITKHIRNRKSKIDQIKSDVEKADSSAFDASVKSNKNAIDGTAEEAAKKEAKQLTIEEQAQKLAQAAAKKVAGEVVRRRQPDPLSDLVNGHLRRYNANFIADATAMGVSPETAQKIEESAQRLRDMRVATKTERERFKAMQDERMRVKRQLARENKYIYGERPTIWEDYQQMFSERLARRLMRDPKKKVPPSLLLFTDRLTENLLGFVPQAERQTTTERSFQAMIEDALNNKEKYQEAFNKAMRDISAKVEELEAKASETEEGNEAYFQALAAQDFMDRLAPIIQDFPVSDKLVMRFVNQKMKAAGESLVAKYNEWYRSSKKTRLDIEQQLANALVTDVKISDIDALKLSRAIIKDFRVKAEERREKALARFKKPKEKTKKLIESPLKKFFELINIGAMTDRDAYEVMAHRFDLPTWDQKFADQIDEMAKLIQDMPDGIERRRMTRNLMAEIAKKRGFNLADLGAGFAYSNILSSPDTFNVNLADTLINNFSNAFADAVSEKDFTRLRGVIAGYKKGWREAVQTFKTGLRINMPRLEEKTPLTVELVNYGKKGGVPMESTEGMNAIAKTILESPPAKVLNLWKYVTRIMEATDALNYTASVEGQRYAEAARIAREEGLQGKEKQKRINQILNLGNDVYQAALTQAEQEGYTGVDAKFRALEIQDSKIDPELKERSFERGLRDVYRNMPKGLAGYFAARFDRVVSGIENPWVRNALKLGVSPFVITPTNLFNKWLDWSPYGYKRLFFGSGMFLSKEGPYYMEPSKVGSAEFYAQAFKASSSVFVMGLAMGLIKAGLLEIVGRGPSDEEERKQWLADGNKPYTFSFMGGPQISFQYSPWALFLSVAANIANWEKYNKKEDATLLDRSVAAFIASTGVIMDLPFFAGPAEFLKAIESGSNKNYTSAVSKFVEGKMGMVFPNFLRYVDRLFDPTVYDHQGIKAIILDQTPFARRLGVQRVNLFGEPIGQDKPVLDRLVGRFVAFPKPSRESRILAKYDIYPYMPSPKEAKALVDGEEAQMTEEQYNKFVQVVGRETKQRINDLFDPDAEITERERERGKKRISQIFERARARAVREVSTY